MALHLAGFFDWYNSNTFNKPWLIVGKGPTFDSIHKVNLHDYNVLGLNHVMYRIPCLLGHAIDYDVFTMSERNLLCRHIVTPWEPHINFVPGGAAASNLFANKDLNIDVPVLWYNSDRSNKLMIQSGPVVRVKLFSACADHCSSPSLILVLLVVERRYTYITGHKDEQKQHESCYDGPICSNRLLTRFGHWFPLS